VWYLVLSILYNCMELASTIEYTFLHSLYEKEKSEKEALKTEVLKLRDHLQKILQAVYGGKSERYVPNTAQLSLDIVTETPVAATDLSKAKRIEYVKTGTPKKRDLPELNGYLDYLPRVYETREPENIPAGAQKISQEEHLVIENKPGEVFLRVIVIPKYKLADLNGQDNTQIISAATPERPLAKCLAGASFLSQMLVDKFCDHMPVHRQQKRYESMAYQFLTIL
jgi:transposase